MKRAACLVLVSILGFGCQTIDPRLEPLDLFDPRADALIEAQIKRAESRQGLRAAMRMALDAPDFRFRRPERIAVRRPALIRIEVLALFGQIAAVLVTDGVQYQRLDVKSRVFESGPVRDDLLWDMARIRLTPAEAVSLLLGALVPSPGTQRRGVYATEDGGIVIEYSRPGSGNPARARERFEFDGAGLLRGVTHWADSGELTWQADFDDYREVSGTPFAFDVALRFPAVAAHARLEFDSVSFEAELSDALFVLRNPSERSATEIGAEVAKSP